MRLAGDARRRNGIRMDEIHFRNPRETRIGVIRQTTRDRAHKQVQGYRPRSAPLRYHRGVHRKGGERSRASRYEMQQRLRNDGRMLRYENRLGRRMGREIRPMVVSPTESEPLLFGHSEAQAGNAVLHVRAFVELQRILPELT